MFLLRYKNKSIDTYQIFNDSRDLWLVTVQQLNLKDASRIDKLSSKISNMGFGDKLEIENNKNKCTIDCYNEKEYSVNYAGYLVKAEDMNEPNNSKVNIPVKYIIALIRNARSDNRNVEKIVYSDGVWQIKLIATKWIYAFYVKFKYKNGKNGATGVDYESRTGTIRSDFKIPKPVKDKLLKIYKILEEEQEYDS